ncbi:MAG: class I SAM-dependent methyltransferase [SAR324 cluster bacterium]|nr:class I SAM-dependent methyltransferase [SAR324 cluster bacterium]
MLDYYEYVRDRDLFVTYVIANPRADHSKAVGQQEEDQFLIAAISDEDSQGITIKGAKMLGTSAVIADEVLVTNASPLKPGEEMYAYLPHSSLDFPHQDRLREVLAEEGFTDVELVEYLGGASAIHFARKPGPA